MTDQTSRPAPSVLRALLRSEARSGVILIASALMALIIANSPLGPTYFGTLKTYVGGLSVLHWINDGLMALFFLMIGLEIKRELLDGELSTWPRRILPGVAAVGGMVVPAAIYVFINSDNPEYLRGWAIPTATDIAFALGILALLGRCVPVSLKVFLTALAIIDDLGAVAIIAAFYTEDVALTWLGAAAAILLVLWGLNRAGVRRLAPFLALGLVLWFVVLMSGVHATLAGVALALTIPIEPSPGRPDDTESPLHILEHGLQPWVAYLIVPVFGFANSGIDLIGLHWTGAVADVPLGIAAGLFLGKQVGVFAFTWVAIRLRWSDCPRDASLAQIYGVSILCGIGFTMSLFIGLLAFPYAADIQDGVKLGVLTGSLFSALLGAGVLILADPRRRARAATATQSAHPE
ncbi:MAG TPA: Na+/H+ antiporter NhaA [Sphingomicrobium sp.]|nr:Na+/H+ antiporter NhaA [Sphingomicrobium sp.]